MTGSFAVSLTTVTVSVGVMVILPNNFDDRPAASSAIRWDNDVSPDSANSAIRDCNEDRHEIHVEGPVALVCAILFASWRARDCSSPLLDVSDAVLPGVEDEEADTSDDKTVFLNRLRLSTSWENAESAASRRLRHKAPRPDDCGTYSAADCPLR